MAARQRCVVKSNTDYIYVNEDQIDSELKCSICQQAFVRPKIGTKCGHTFCQECIDNWFKQNSTCPSCRERTAFQPLTTRIVLNQLDSNNIERGNFDDHNNRCSEVRVKCQAADLKCTWVGKRSEEAQHSVACPLVTIRPVVADLRNEIVALSHQVQILMNELRQQQSNCVQNQVTVQRQRDVNAAEVVGDFMSRQEYFDELMADMRYRWISGPCNCFRACVKYPYEECRYEVPTFLRCLICSRELIP
ncbi:unnamed protein product, partial [Adineta ricciae]